MWNAASDGNNHDTVNKGRGNRMNTKLWMVTAVYEVFVALPSAVMTGIEIGGILGFLTFVSLTGLYVTALLLVMGLIDYARR